MKGLLLWFIKLMVILVLLMLAFLAFVQFSGGSCIKRIDKSEPAIEKVEWQVTTPMKLYYAEKVDVVTDSKGVISVTMTGWYENINGKWVKQGPPITLERKNYGKITVERRK